MSPKNAGKHKRHTWGIRALSGLLFCTVSQLAAQDPSATQSVEKYVLNERKIDLPEIRKTGALRVAVPYSRTNFFFEGDRFRGFEYELFHELEKQLNQMRKKGDPTLNVVFHLTPVANLISDVTAGRADVAAGIVITEERKASVAFTRPYLSGINTVVVSNQMTPPIASLDQLADQSVFVNRGSSYPQLLEQLGKQLRQKKLAPPKVELVETLETEDILELLNSGAISWTIVHEHHADLWKKAFPKLRVYSDLKLGEPVEFAWAVRKDSPALLEALNGFVAANRQGTVVGNVLLKRYFQSTQWVGKPTLPLDQARLAPLVSLFKKYSEKHAITWIGLAAVAFQESRFDPNLRSKAGAVGLMQIRPETAKEVGIVGIADPEKNVEAAARYFDLLAEKYFNDPGMGRHDRVALILAAYNAGPARIQAVRRAAAEADIDPNRWFGQMDALVLQKVGREPVQYVTNVAKYYLILSRLLLTAEQRSAESLDLQ